MATLKLNSFRENDKKKNAKTIVISVIIILVVIASFWIYKTYAYYKQVEGHDVIKTKVGDFKKAVYTSYDNENTNLDCTGENATAQCAIDKLAEILGE